MNFRLSSAELRIRLEKPEAEKLLQTGNLRQEFQLTSETMVVCSLLAIETKDDLSVAIQDCHIKCQVSKDALSNLLRSGPSKESSISITNSSGFLFSMEIDLFSFKNKMR